MFRRDAYEATIFLNETNITDAIGIQVNVSTVNTIEWDLYAYSITYGAPEIVTAVDGVIGDVGELHLSPSDADCPGQNIAFFPVRLFFHSIPTAAVNYIYSLSLYTYDADGYVGYSYSTFTLKVEGGQLLCSMFSIERH